MWILLYSHSYLKHKIFFALGDVILSALCEQNGNYNGFLARDCEMLHSMHCKRCACTLLAITASSFFLLFFCCCFCCCCWLLVAGCVSATVCVWVWCALLLPIASTSWFSGQNRRNKIYNQIDIKALRFSPYFIVAFAMPQRAFFLIPFKLRISRDIIYYTTVWLGGVVSLDERPNVFFGKSNCFWVCGVVFTYCCR